MKVFPSLPMGWQSTFPREQACPRRCAAADAQTGSLNATPLNGSPSFVHMQLSSLRRKKAPNGIKGTFNQEAERSNSG